MRISELENIVWDRVSQTFPETYPIRFSRYGDVLHLDWNTGGKEEKDPDPVVSEDITTDMANALGDAMIEEIQNQFGTRTTFGPYEAIICHISEKMSADCMGTDWFASINYYVQLIDFSPKTG